jgi:excisionase family DNA binding protein
LRKRNVLSKLIEGIAERETAMTVPQLAKILCISTRSIYEHVQAGRLPSIKIGTTVRLDPSQVASWLTKRAA